jgi:hypothetical protein
MIFFSFLLTHGQTISIYFMLNIEKNLLCFSLASILSKIDQSRYSNPFQIMNEEAFELLTPST